MTATMTVEGERKVPYITGVDVPRHVAVGDQLAIDVATDLAVAPAIVDVDRTDHVPLRRREEDKMQQIKTLLIADGPAATYLQLQFINTMYSNEGDSWRDRGEKDMKKTERVTDKMLHKKIWEIIVLK